MRARRAAVSLEARPSTATPSPLFTVPYSAQNRYISWRSSPRPTPQPPPSAEINNAHCNVTKSGQLTYCGYKGGIERVFAEPEEQARLADTAISYEQEFEKVVVRFRHFAVRAPGFGEMTMYRSGSLLLLTQYPYGVKKGGRERRDASASARTASRLMYFLRCLLPYESGSN